MLGDLPGVGFVNVADLDVAQPFYEGRLGLRLLSRNDFALVFDVGGRTLRVTEVGEAHAAQPYTVFGWEAADVRATVTALRTRGVDMLRYPHIDQDELGLWTAPGGAVVAWFADPDGNVLSVSSG